MVRCCTELNGGFCLSCGNRGSDPTWKLARILFYHTSKVIPVAADSQCLVGRFSLWGVPRRSRRQTTVLPAASRLSLRNVDLFVRAPCLSDIWSGGLKFVFWHTVQSITSLFSKHNGSFGPWNRPCLLLHVHRDRLGVMETLSLGPNRLH
jgi:hypothetical protein